MSKNFLLFAFTTTLLFFSSQKILSQTTDFKHQPIGYLNEKLSNTTPVVVAPPDLNKIQEEDKKDTKRKRFAVPQNLGMEFKKSAQITENVDGRRVYTLHIHSDKARSLAFTLENLNIGADENIFVYSTDRKTGYKKINTDREKILTEFISGADIVIEFNQPSAAAVKNPFTISKLWYAYGGLAVNDFNASAACEVNIACATDFKNQRRGVVRILAVMTNGAYWGSGSLVNNTNQDGKPYVLTAFHIIDGMTPDYTQWQFLFNYELPTCAASTTEPVGSYIQGCTFRAGLRDDDFALFELSIRVPPSLNAYFNGWSRDTTNLSATTTIIHHPLGDVKKITRSAHTETVVTTPTAYANNVVAPAYSHLQCTIDNGILEPGSSGSPFFDANGRIVAQLHGANANAANPCNVTFAQGGRFGKSWDGGGTAATRLKDWLDPGQTNPITLDGTNTPSYLVSGHLNFWTNPPMTGVKVVIGNDSTTTDTNGYFSFSNVPAGITLNVRIEKPDTYDNGVDATDILIMRRHILGISTLDNSVYKLAAADVNNSSDVDAADLLILRRFVLGISSTLQVATPWKFILKSAASTTPSYPAGVTFNNGFIFSSAVTNFDIQGIKIGDIDGSASY